MAKFKGSVALAGGITTMGEGGYPLVNAADVQIDDNGKTLAEYIEEGAVSITIKNETLIITTK